MTTHLWQADPVFRPAALIERRSDTWRCQRCLESTTLPAGKQPPNEPCKGRP